MTQQLQAQGKEVAPVAMVQSTHPDYSKFLLDTSGQRRLIYRIMARFDIEGAANTHTRMYGLGENQRFRRSIQGGIGPVPKQSRIVQRWDKRSMECEVPRAKRYRYVPRFLQGGCHTRILEIAE